MTTISQIATRDREPESSSCLGDGHAMISSARSSWLARIAAAYEAAINHLVPLGYEDECGFHFGQPQRFVIWDGERQEEGPLVLVVAETMVG